MSNVTGESDNTSTESGTTGMVGNNPRGSWEIPETSLTLELDRSEKVRYHNADVYVSTLGTLLFPVFLDLGDTVNNGSVFYFIKEPESGT